MDDQMGRFYAAPSISANIHCTFAQQVEAQLQIRQNGEGSNLTVIQFGDSCIGANLSLTLSREAFEAFARRVADYAAALPTPPLTVLDEAFYLPAPDAILPDDIDPDYEQFIADRPSLEGR